MIKRLQRETGEWHLLSDKPDELRHLRKTMKIAFSLGKLCINRVSRYEKLIFFIAILIFSSVSFAGIFSPWGMFGAKTYDECISQAISGVTQNLTVKTHEARRECGQKFKKILEVECYQKNKCTELLAIERSRIKEETVRSRETGKRYFFGYRCYADCSGHEAGYFWAKGHIKRKTGRLETADDCTGNSASFIEGCQMYMDDRNEEDIDDPRESKGCHSRDC